MTCKTKNRKKEDTIRMQMVEVAWKMVSIIDELSNKLWEMFDKEFIEKANKEIEDELPF